MRWIPLVGLFAIGSTARADDAPASPPPADPNAPAVPVIPAAKSDGALYLHDGQIGISVRSGVGLRGIAPYSDKDYCGSTSSSSSTGNAAVCLGRAPISLDLEMSYGLSRHVDILGEIRLGIESDFGSSSTTNNGPHEVQLSPGLRLFFSESHATKLFATAQAVFDFSDYKDITGMGRGTDIGVRNLNGLWFDFNKSFGAYAFAGETLGFARWLQFELEIGIGIQGRYP